jgi:hypothetical protein
MKKDEKKLRFLINKTIKENYINEFDFKKIASKISNFFSRKSNVSNQSKSTNAQPASSTGFQNQSGSIKKNHPTTDDFWKIKYLVIGQNKVSTNNVDFSFFYNLYKKVGDNIEKDIPPAFQWLYSKNAIFSVSNIFLKSDFDSKKPKKTDIVFQGVWEKGDFKGFFKSGVFKGGDFYGVYAGKSENFLPNKSYSEKIKAFKGVSWLSLDGLFGLKYVNIDNPPKEFHMLQLQKGNFVAIKYGVKEEVVKITVLKKPFAEDFSYEFSVQKQNPKTKRFFAPEIYSGNLVDIQNNPEKYYVSAISKSLFFLEKPTSNISIISFGKK